MLDLNRLPIYVYPTASPKAFSLDLVQTQMEFKIAENYFSDILQAQLAIFILIVTILSALSWYFQYKTTKGQINKEVLSSTKKMRANMKAEFKEEVQNLDKKISDRFSNLADDVGATRGNVYRSMALFWDSQKNYSVAFVWWVRAANQFSKIGDKNLTRIGLGKAKESVAQIQFATELTPDDISEYQELTAQIDDKMYKTEKDSLDQAMKSTLSKT